MKTIPENWTDLPPDLLHLILAKLSDISDICDYIRLRAVCKSWRCSISVSDLPPQFPWIMKLGDNKESLLEFYSFASKKVYTMHAPNSSNKSLGLSSMLVRQFGSDDLFSLVLCKKSCQFREGYCSFLNPVNNSEVYLPVVHDPEPSSFRFCWSGPRSFHSENCVIFSYGINRLAVCKSNGDKWDCIGGDLGYEYAYLNGLLFTIEYWKSGFTRVIDIGTRQEAYVIPPQESTMRGIPFLVESSGEILLVCYIHTYIREIKNYSWSNICSELEIHNDNRRDEVHKFYIHRLEFGNGEEKPCWVKVTSIGDQMLFIDFVARRAFSLKACEFPGFKGNSIYYIDTQDSKIYRYDMENDSFKKRMGRCA
ncbi:F-box/kelch-repeat protein [Carex littledalei]|uniref:F-box/kelch-repeat protein n=1 Tax=Carex littledalei TaxID=544730 RepID=A0A833VRZ6_9POAL|nr:F-box/kelch-repeat protein [Carex littledalei]